MISRALHVLRRSMAAQVIVPTLVLILIASLLAVRIARHPPVLPPTIELTQATVYTNMITALTPDGQMDVARFWNSDDVQRVRSANPGFYFSFYTGQRQYGARPGPMLAFLTRQGQAIDRATGGRPCQTVDITRPSLRVGTAARILFVTCNGKTQYVELHNIVRPVRFAEIGDDEPLFTHLLNAVTGNLVGVGVAILLVAIITVLAFQAVRQMARVAADFDPERGDRAIPLDDLAMEVRPLARIVNTLAQQLRDSYQRQQLFLAAAAHELRTPLAALRIRAESLAPGAAKDEVVHDIRAMSYLSDQLLTITGIGYRHEDRHDFLLASALDDVVFDMCERTPGRRVVLDLPAGHDWMVRGGNAQLFGLAVHNLLRNADSIAPRDTPITVAVRHDGVILVEDCGPGIPPHIRARLFDPFVKYPAEREGSGLGLAIVREIVDFHNGTITSFETACGGAGFSIDLHPEPCT